MKVHGQLFESRPDASVLFQPADALLHDRPAAVGVGIKVCAAVVPGFLIALVRNHRLDAPALEPVPHSLDAVAFVAGEFPRFMPTLPSLASPTDQAGHRLPGAVVSEQLMISANEK